MKKKNFCLGSRRLWALLALAFLLVIAFWRVAERVAPLPGAGPTDFHRLDAAILQELAVYRNPALNQVMIELSALGSRSVIVVLALAVFLLIAYQRDWRGGFYWALVLAGASFWPVALKGIYERPRPSVTPSLVGYSGLSFPSGHSFGAAAIYFGLTFLASRYLPRIRDEAVVFSFAGLLILIVGITRIYLGVHYPSDVVGGICAGAAWSFALAAFFVRKRR